jgi:thimet oligopeptidase
LAGATAARTVTLGRLPFSLPAERLRREAAEILAESRARVEELLSLAAPPTIASFLGPLDRALLAARDVGNHGSFLFQVHPDAEIRAAAREISEASDRFFNELRLNDRLFRSLRALELGAAGSDERFAVEKMVREMRRAGVEQPPERRERLVALTNRIDQTVNQFSSNIAKGERSIDLDGPARLKGLSTDYVAAHAPGADGTIRITTKYPDVVPVLASCDDPEVRRRLLAEVLNVAYPENLEVLDRLLGERHELARLLRYADYAEFATEDKMMERPGAVAEFLERLASLLTEPAHRDHLRFLERKRRSEPAAEALEPWDASFWGDGYYDTRIRGEEFGVDPRVLRSFLPYTSVRDGLFRLCGELFGLTFHPCSSVTLWHPSVEAYDVARHGLPLGRCYFDLVPRSNKYSHAAQFDVRTGLATGDLPQAALVCNFLDPGTPVADARMEYRDVITFFHEFGHLLHNLFSGHGPWLYTSMGYIELDFIEAPSQLFEEWARDPATLARFARNPDTGEAIPPDLLRRLAAAESVGRAERQLRQVALAGVSLDLYRRDPAGIDTTAVFRSVWDRRCPVPLDPGYHPQAAWGHLTGYSACYYTYLWSAVIARDLLTPFHRSGSLTDRGAAERYADEILIPGSRRPAAELVRRYLGREFDFAAYERWVLADPGATARGSMGNDSG